MDDSVKISVIVPSYNQGEYISNVIQSVIQQTYKNWELIIQDGGSRDNTVEICKVFSETDMRISWNSEKDKGFADAVNKGLKKATGHLAVIQSSDDFFVYPDVFRDVVSIYVGDRNLRIISGNAIVVDHALNHLKTVEKTSGYIQPDSIYSLRTSFSQSATFFSLERAAAIGGLDTAVDMVADTDFWIRLACTTPVYTNSIFQSSKAWGAVLIQPNQRSSDFSKFYVGRSQMAIRHLENDAIPYSQSFKKVHANNLLLQAFRHFKANGLNCDQLQNLYYELNKTKYTEPERSLKQRVHQKLFGRPLQHASPNTIQDVYLDKEFNTQQNYKWFESSNG